MELFETILTFDHFIIISNHRLITNITNLATMTSIDPTINMIINTFLMVVFLTIITSLVTDIPYQCSTFLTSFIIMVLRSLTLLTIIATDPVSEKLPIQFDQHNS